MNDYHESPTIKKQIKPMMLSQATNDFMHQKSPQGDQNQGKKTRGNSKMNIRSSSNRSSQLKGLTIEQKMNYLEERASKNYLLYPHLYPRGKGDFLTDSPGRKHSKSNRVSVIKDYDEQPVKILPAELDIFQRN